MLRRLIIAIAALVMSGAAAHAASCYISEFNIALPAGAQIATVPPVVVQTPITIGASTQSAVFNADTKMVRIVCDATAAIVFGTNPTATVATGIPISTESTEYFGVRTGDRVAVITR
jgi:hypothetical protein